MSTDHTDDTPVNMPARTTMPGRWTHIRIPRDLAARLDQLARHLERLHATGKIALPAEHCDRCPVHHVITRALDEQQARRERSRRPRRKGGRS